MRHRYFVAVSYCRQVSVADGIWGQPQEAAAASWTRLNLQTASRVPFRILELVPIME